MKGFKSLKDIAPQALKPMTILVGKNSCGKSSFLRVLPLLKQSAEENIDGPLSLYGNYVDYGDFEDVLTEKNENERKYKQFQFYFEGLLKNISRPRYHSKNFPVFSEKNLRYAMWLTFRKKENGNIYVSQILLTLGKDYKVDIKIKESDEIQSISINSHHFECVEMSAFYPRLSRGILPNILRKNSNRRAIHFISNINEYWLNKDFPEDLEYILNEFDLMSLQSTQTLDDYVKELSDFAKMDLTKISNINIKLVFALLPEIISRINYAIYSVVSNVNYSKPIRANAERYYRYKPLHANEISPDGSNLAHVLSNFTDSERSEFEDWVDKEFGFKVFVRGDSLKQIVIQIKDDKNKKDKKTAVIEHNIVDMGFGYTQILPIIVQLWISTNGIGFTPMLKRTPLFAIEQPELHLHPALQKTLLRTFCKAIEKTNGEKPRFLLETHSKTFVMLLGELIEQKMISPEDVSILVFDNENGKNTKVIQSYFNNDGDLENWPIGFFG